MRHSQDQVVLSATDLVNHASCHHLTTLNLQVAKGSLSKPYVWDDPMLDILRERGLRHEQAFLDHLAASGLVPTRIEGNEISEESVEATLEAMRAGSELIVQAALRSGRWTGRADVLRRVETPSAFGNWSYDVTDTKLARETKAGTVLQLCLYSELLGEAQGCQPEYTHVVAPWTNFVPQTYRVADFAAYFRKAKAAAEAATEGAAELGTYPEPNEHCEVCRWFETCDKRRRHDDHLTFVAGISRNQITELGEQGVTTLGGLAEVAIPLPWKPKRGAVESYGKVREQARIQAAGRETGELLHELLPVEPGYGFCLLPEPSPGDIFFDLEGDPFVGEHGLEYLFGYHYRSVDGAPLYTADWSFTRDQEKQAFETFVDFVVKRMRIFPDLHIYHFAPYEPSALKRLMGRYATRESEIDDLLRGQRFVDLYSAVRNGLRASVESYSIKRLEAFYGYQRTIPLKVANVALTGLQAGLELGDFGAVTEADKQIVQGYNQDDCVSTEALRTWLETLRSELVRAGTDVPRPLPGQDSASEAVSDRQQRVERLVQRLTDRPERSEEQQAQWVLANILDWHRREGKAVSWEYFRLKGLSADELLDERDGLSGLEFIGDVPTNGRMPVHRYSFPPQDTDIRAEDKLHVVGDGNFGHVVAISPRDRTIDIKKTAKTVDVHPAAVFPHTQFKADEQAEALLRIGEYVAENGIVGEGRFLAARDLLLRQRPRVRGQAIREAEETTLEAAIRLAGVMEGGVLPIQGPPGTGKSHTGARMICRLVQLGLKVGVTANSHAVIRNLLDKVIEASREMQVDLRCIQKAKDVEPNQPGLLFAKNNPAVFSALAAGDCQVAGATSFLWARAEAEDVLDVLVVDEATQVSLANVLAVSHAARRLVLLGDPQQLDQPNQGTHPDGTGVSSLEHVLNGAKTIEPDRGLFLADTWRMHPEICAFDSEMFYEGKLRAIEGSGRQAILSDGESRGARLRFVSVAHTGNKSSSIEEAEAVAELVSSILDSGARWIDRDGGEQPLTLNDIIIITPYNAQVFEIKQRLPGARVGTVDKFQGQEAPIAIYSMATSSSADAPRGMEFLYSANRLNVAVSRAKCLSILVASPEIFEAECRTPRQMQLANAFCRNVEVASAI